MLKVYRKKLSISWTMPPRQRALWLRSGASAYCFRGDRDRESHIYTTLLRVRANIIYWIVDFKNSSHFEKCENVGSISWGFQYPRGA